VQKPRKTRSATAQGAMTDREGSSRMMARGIGRQRPPLPGEHRPLTRKEITYLWDHRDQLGDWRETFEAACRQDAIVMVPVTLHNVVGCFEPKKPRPTWDVPDEYQECRRAL